MSTRLLRSGIDGGRLLVAALAVSAAAWGQSPAPGNAPGAAAPSAASIVELQRQITELDAALREMRGELAATRSEAAGLKQELSRTRVEIEALAGGAVSRPSARSAAGPEPLPLASLVPAALDERLSKLEEGEELLGSEVRDLNQTKVDSGSKYRVRLSGMALFNAFSTRGATDNFDLPSYAEPRYPSQPNAAFGATLRQSILGLDVFGPEVAGARTSGDVQVDFFGGLVGTPNGASSGVLRLRTAGVHLDWTDTSLVVGQYQPFFLPLSPTSLASVAYPALAYSGNLWVWTPELYVEQRVALSGSQRLILQGGVLDPLSGETPAVPQYRTPGAGESSGRPAFAARIAWSAGPADRPATLGAALYESRQNWAFGHMIDSWAGTLDFSVPLGRKFTWTGELFDGHALGGLGAAGGQSITWTGNLYSPYSLVQPVLSTGGWTQLKFAPTARLEFNGAYGADFSYPGGQPANGGYSGVAIGSNQSGFFNTIYHLRSNLMLSAEYRRLRSSADAPGIATANQVSLSAATLF